MALIAEELIRRERAGNKVDIQIKFTDTVTGKYVKQYFRFPANPPQPDVDARVEAVRLSIIDTRRQQSNAWNVGALAYLEKVQSITKRVWNFVPQAIVGNPSITAGELATAIDAEFPNHIIDLTKMLALILEHTRFNTFADLKTHIVNTQGDLLDQ